MWRHRMLTIGIWALSFYALFLFDTSARAAEASAFDGRTLDLAWTIPFAGLLLSIALIPLIAPHFWHHHHGKISAAWAIAFLIPFTLRVGLPAAIAEVAHIFLLEYIPFIVLLFALFTVAGGVRFAGRLSGSPGSNTAVLAFGTVMASIVGTTGASILLIRPLISANLWGAVPPGRSAAFPWLSCGRIVFLADDPSSRANTHIECHPSRRFFRARSVHTQP